MRKIFLILCSLMLSLLIGACANHDLPKGLACDIDNLPAWESFSATNYESYAFSFSKVNTVIYKYNGTENTINHDDPRVIRLLNFLAYSDKKSLSTWRQGYVSQDEVQGYLMAGEPVLEIIFHSNEISETHSYASLQKLLICGDSYLRFIDINGELRIERCWPYGELIMCEITEESRYEDFISYDGWGSNYWIDLLTYSGFGGQGDGSVVPADEHPIDPK